MGALDDPVVVGLALRGEWLVDPTPTRRIASHGTDLFARRYAYDLLVVSSRGYGRWRDAAGLGE